MIKNNFNKKADMMPEEALKIIMAVLGVVLLLYLAFSLYGIFMSKTQLEQASAVLSSLSGKANVLESGNNASVLVTSPRDWNLYVFNSGQISPKLCSNSACICICEQYFSTAEINKAVDSCEKNGVCQKIKSPIVVDTPELDKTLRFRTLPRIIHLQNNGSILHIIPDSSYGAINAVNYLATSSQMNNIIAASVINFDDNNKSILRAEINKKIPGGHWDLQIKVDSKRELSLISEDWNLFSSDDRMAYSILLNYAPFTDSFTMDNKKYDVELRVAQYE